MPLPSMHLLVSAALAVGMCVAPAESAPNAQNALAEALVTRAVSGDALDARVDGMRTALGLLGVRAPSPNEPCGAEALARTQELAGDRVLIQSDAAYDLDARGLRLFYGFSLDGTSIDETLIREGLGYAERTDAQYGAYLAGVQAEAEAAGVGCLWGGTEAPTPQTEP
jgi:endonuclease YncB( thermonuclease family)